MSLSPQASGDKLSQSVGLEAPRASGLRYTGMYPECGCYVMFTCPEADLRRRVEEAVRTAVAESQSKQVYHNMTRFLTG